MKQISIFSNRNQYSQKIKNTLINKLEQRGYRPLLQFHPDSELNICIGGDGAFLKSVHRSSFSEIPFVGINTGHLGFFQEIATDNLDQFLDAYEAGQYHVEKIPLLKAICQTKRSKFTYYALNEFLYKGMLSHMIQFDVFLDKIYVEKFGGDGMMISSSVGSTGHNASLGGAIIHPKIHMLQMTPLAPLSSNTYRSLRNPLIIPKNSIIEFVPEPRYMNSSILVVDGMEKRQRSLEKIQFILSDKCISRLVFDENWYWKNLKDKFL